MDLPDDFNFDDEDRLDSSFFQPSEEGEERPPRDAQDLEEKEVTVVGVYEHREEGSAQPPSAFVLVRDAKERSVLIFIGKFEAMSIWLALEGTSADRPLTHDLLNNVIMKMGGTIERVLIDDLWNNTYYAKVTISQNGNTMDIDARPSDGIAVALRAKAKVYMAESVLERAAVKEE